MAHNRSVVGSKPARPTNNQKVNDMKKFLPVTVLALGIAAILLLMSGCEVLDRSKSAGENKREYQKSLAEGD